MLDCAVNLSCIVSGTLELTSFDIGTVIFQKLQMTTLRVNLISRI